LSKSDLSAELLEVTRWNDVILIRFNRPEKLNALNLEMWMLLRDALSKECSGGGKAIVVTGSGRAFSAGDDIEAMLNLLNPKEAVEFFNIVRGALETLAMCPKPVVAAVNGLAVGGGAEMLLLVDYVIASRESWFSFPEARIGLIPPVLLTLGLDVVGLRSSRKLALMGYRIGVEEALRLGLVDEIADSDKLLETAYERALELSAKTTSEAMKALKGLLYSRYSTLIDVAIESLATLCLTESAKDRMRAFLEKRFKP
jgi:enoyl-CoA hydratase/carnithine racemase